MQGKQKMWPHLVTLSREDIRVGASDSGSLLEMLTVVQWAEKSGR